MEFNIFVKGYAHLCKMYSVGEESPLLHGSKRITIG